MDILVLSDSHGAVAPMVRAVELAIPDLILHLGDCWRDGERLWNRCRATVTSSRTPPRNSCWYWAASGS